MIDEIDRMRHDQVMIWWDLRFVDEVHGNARTSMGWFQIAIPFRTVSVINEEVFHGVPRL